MVDIKLTVERSKLLHAIMLKKCSVYPTSSDKRAGLFLLLALNNWDLPTVYHSSKIQAKSRDRSWQKFGQFLSRAPRARPGRQDGRLDEFTASR